MSKTDTIEQAKQARADKLRLGEELRELVQSWQTTPRTWERAQGNPFQVVQARKKQEEALYTHTRQRVEDLLRAGVDVDTHVAQLGQDGKPLGMVSAMNFFLAERTTVEMAYLFCQHGGRVDQRTLHLLAGHAQRLSGKTGAFDANSTLPVWFSTLLERAMAMPGLDWERTVDELDISQLVQLRSSIGAPVLPARPIRISKAIAKLCKGFEDQLYDTLLQRGEPAGFPALPAETTAEQATWMLYEILSDGRGVEKFERSDKLMRVEQLLRLGADPMAPQEPHMPKDQRTCAMDLACKHLDSEMVEVLLSQGAQPTPRNTMIAVRSALEMCHRLPFLPVSITQDPDDRVMRYCKALCGVLVQLDQRGVVDLESMVYWEKRSTSLTEHRVRETMQEAIEQHLPALLPQFLPQQQARILGQSTPQSSGARGPRRL